MTTTQTPTPPPRTRVRPLAAHRLATVATLGACVLGAAGLVAAPAQAKEYTHVAEEWGFQIKGTATDHRITEGGELTDDVLLSVPFSATANGVKVYDGVPFSSKALAFDQGSSQPTTFERTLTERDRGASTCQVGAWPTPSGGEVVVTDLTGPNGGWLASFKPADRFDGPSLCSGWANGLYDGPTTAGGMLVDVRFEVPKNGVTEEPIRIEAEGPGGQCPPEGSPNPFKLCSSKYIATIYAKRYLNYVHTTDKPPAPGSPVAEGTKKPGGGVGILSGLKGTAGRKDGTVTAKCATACTGKVSAYAVALSKQGKTKGKGKLVGSGRLQRLKAGASPRAAASGTRVGARIRFGRSAQRLVRQRGHVEYRVDVRPKAGGDAVRSTVVSRVRRG